MPIAWDRQSAARPAATRGMLVPGPFGIPQMKTLRCLLTAVACLLAAGGSSRAAKNPADQTRRAENQPSPLRMTVDRSKYDEQQHRLEVKVSHPVPAISIKVTGMSGEILADERQDFSGRPAGAPLVITWHPSSDEKVARIDLHAADTRGFVFDVVLTPWFLPIPHQEVNFRTDSADIDEPEVPKLEDAYTWLVEHLAEIRAKDINHEHRNLTLHICGHTDTVGDATHNFKLSEARARSIAAWFRKKGVALPVAYAGFGEWSLLISTADQVDEPRNRRADYILSDDEPSIKTRGPRPVWKRLN